MGSTEISKIIVEKTYFPAEFKTATAQKSHLWVGKGLDNSSDTAINKHFH